MESIHFSVYQLIIMKFLIIAKHVLIIVLHITVYQINGTIYKTLPYVNVSRQKS